MNRISRSRIYPIVESRRHYWWLVSALTKAPPKCKKIYPIVTWLLYFSSIMLLCWYTILYYCVIVVLLSSLITFRNFVLLDFEEVSRRVKTLMSSATITHNLPIAEALVNTKLKGWAITGVLSLPYFSPGCGDILARWYRQIGLSVLSF